MLKVIRTKYLSIRLGTTHGHYRGSGYFISFGFSKYTVLFCVRKKWHLDYVHVFNGNKKRFYVGPIELEINKWR